MDWLQKYITVDSWQLEHVSNKSSVQVNIVSWSVISNNES